MRATTALLAAILIVLNVPASVGVKAAAKSADKTNLKGQVETVWQDYLAGKHKQAAKQLKRLADKKNARAQNYLGSLYASGHGVKKNQKLAAHWYKRAAKQGLAAAQFNIGFLLLYGAGDGEHQIKANPRSAARWLSKAAKQNDTDAQFLLCKLYHQGRGVPRNYEKAKTLCRIAATKGLAGAQFELGTLLIRSLDTKQFPEAYKWFLLAAKQRYPGAGHNVRLLAQRLKPDQKNQVETTVKDWKPKN